MVAMDHDLQNLEKLDLKALRQLVTLKENSRELGKLESKRQKLRDELTDIEARIRTFLGQFPEIRRYLASTGGNVRRLTPSGRRPRGWVQGQVEDVLVESDRPLTPAEVRDEIARKHPEEATKNLYLAVFQHLRRHDEFEQDEQGRWRILERETTS
ncbi:MAG TPA: hypothetical protein EYN79_04935 [Planctomycetes bacterium]|nr:hypothetical protein [Planctomycetota bacterium]HIN79759.1 hypothetical protein [Planctomycetota bacterium]